MVPGNGLILKPNAVAAIEETLDKGCWTPQEVLGKEWQHQLISDDGSQFRVLLNNEQVATVNWSLIGEHNVNNGLMAIAAARHVGVAPNTAAEALAQFKKC